MNLEGDARSGLLSRQDLSAQMSRVFLVRIYGHPGIFSPGRWQCEGEFQGLCPRSPHSNASSGSRGKRVEIGKECPEKRGKKGSRHTLNVVVGRLWLSNRRLLPPGAAGQRRLKN